MKNIGIDCRMMGTLHGGIGRYVFEVASNIVTLDQSNQYHLFYNKHAVLQEDLDYFKKFSHVKLIPTNIRHYSVAEQTKFAYLLNKLNLDLVHFPNFNVPLFYNKPFIVTIHDVVHHKIGGAKKTHLVHFYAYKKIIEHAAQQSRHIITVSEAAKKDIIGIFNQPDHKVSVIYEGTSLPEQAVTGGVEKVKKNYVLTKSYFLFVGTLERKKNIVNLTRGFDVFIKKYGCDMLLVLAGKVDKHYPEVKHKALDIKSNDRLVFTDYISDEDLVALYQGAHAFVSASQHEGFGLPGVEAMKYGLPLVVSNIEVFNEIYDNAAVYFDPGSPEDIAEQMRLVAKDTQFYNQLSVNSKKRSELFDWKKTAEDTLKIYKSILS